MGQRVSMEETQQWFKAAEDGDVASMARYLNAHPTILNGKISRDALERVHFRSPGRLNVDIQTVGANGFAPALHLAVVNNRLNVVDFLAQQGANFDELDFQGFPALQHAITMRNEAMVECLAFHGATIYGYFEMKYFLGMHLAVQYNLYSSVRVLYQFGAVVTSTGPDMRCPIHYLTTDTADGHMVWLLLSLGSKIDPRDNYARTPLHLAARDGRIEAVYSLLYHGAQIDAVDFYKDTPLHLAAVTNSLAVVQMLVRYGADVNLRNATGKTACDVALEQKSHACYQFLRYLNQE
eukprot:TRINITY_DN6409_c0_g1_i2.p1 TRINITY_DN6409_c0_g1~~TRINITY_DN6409_c0_g1_i2.p1  ORF type:complete len:294 (-),score=2.92 TRINITY_DN6409_c0_g1_i2:48-929(-)